MTPIRAEELEGKLKHLTLWGQDEYGELEWVGTLTDFNQSRNYVR